MAMAMPRAAGSAAKKSPGQPPMSDTTTSMSRLRTPRWSSAYLWANVDLPTPGGPLMCISLGMS